jgi:hypothetical protein
MTNADGGVHRWDGLHSCMRNSAPKRITFGNLVDLLLRITYCSDGLPRSAELQPAPSSLGSAG